MTDAKQTAWREYCRKLEAIGVDPYAPDIPADDPRHEQVVAIVAEYQAATTHKVALPPMWEGHQPIQPVETLPQLAEWLSFQWRLVKAGELAGDTAKAGTLRDAMKAIRNAFRVLEWLGVKERPERPLPPSTLDEAKQQIDDLERWVRRKHKSGWKPSNKTTALAKATAAAKPGKRSDAIPDDEANILIRKFLEQHPKATARDVAEGVGVALGRIPRMAAWRAEVGRRKAAKSPPKKTPIPLTKQMLETIKRGDDPAKVAELRDQVFNKILATAYGKKSELEQLHGKTTAEKDSLIDAFLQQYADQLVEEPDE